MLTAQLPQSEGIANAFDWDAAPKRIDEKYGAGTAAIRALYEELMPLMSARMAAE